MNKCSARCSRGLRMRLSLSRMPRSVRPNGERTNRHIANATTAARQHGPIKRAVGQQHRRTNIARIPFFAPPVTWVSVSRYPRRSCRAPMSAAGSRHRRCAPRAVEDRRNHCGGNTPAAKATAGCSPEGRGVDDDIGGDAEERAMAKRGAPAKPARISIDIARIPKISTSVARPTDNSTAATARPRPAKQ